MRISWTFPELFGILFLGFIALAAGLSRLRPVTESWVAILGAHYLVINTTCWNAFMMTATWESGGQVSGFGGEVFHFGTSPFLPAASFYLGVFTAVMMLGAVCSTWRSSPRYTKRQRLSFLVAAIVLLIGIFVSLRTPIALQPTIDAFSRSHQAASQHLTPSAALCSARASPASRSPNLRSAARTRCVEFPSPSCH